MEIFKSPRSNEAFHSSPHRPWKIANWLICLERAAGVSLKDFTNILDITVEHCRKCCLLACKPANFIQESLSKCTFPSSSRVTRVYCFSRSIFKFHL